MRTSIRGVLRGKEATVIPGKSCTQLRSIDGVPRLGGSYLGRHDAETETIAIHAG
jgi:hypothetical protein